MNPKLTSRIGPVIGALLFAAALVILHHQIRQYDYKDILDSVRRTADSRLVLAVLLTACSYLVLTGYDVLALRYIGRPLPYRVAGVASFVGYAFSNNGGFPLVTGGSVRYRLYSAWGLSALDIAKIMLFCMLTFWVGFLAVGSLSFVAEPLPLPATLRLPFPTTEAIGWAGLSVVVAYLLVATVWRKPLGFRNWELQLPRLPFAIGQVILAATDLLLASAVLYCLLPEALNMSYPAFVGIFMLAMVSGVVSQVPGGLGVFETVLLLMLGSQVPGSAIIGSLLAFRAVYYFLPLVLAALLLGGVEGYRQRHLFSRAARLFGTWEPTVAPQVFAVSVFLGGAILLLSGSTPAMRDRFAAVLQAIPLGAIESAHVLGSVAGAGLLLLARGLQERVRQAYYAASVLLALGATTSFLKGLNYVEAVILATLLASLLPCRALFYRRISLFRPQLGLWWSAGTAFVILASLWLAFFAYRHEDYVHSLWLSYGPVGDLSRTLRAGGAAVLVFALYSVARLLLPAAPRPVVPGSEALARAEAVVEQSPVARDRLALLGDKLLLFNDRSDAFIMYGIDGRGWVALGDPVGNERERGDLIWHFREVCDRHGAWCVFYDVGEEHLPLYLDIGLAFLKFGEEARVDLRARGDTAVLGSDGADERIEVIPRERVPEWIPELSRISDRWLTEHGLRERRFSMGYFRPDYLARLPVALLRRRDRPVAFAPLWSSAGREELSADFVRHASGAPDDVLERFFHGLMDWGAREGYRWFNLGAAPLSDTESRMPAAIARRLDRLPLRHGEHFASPQELRRFKEGFAPTWRPRYLATPGGLVVPRVLGHVAALIEGGPVRRRKRWPRRPRLRR